MKNEKFIKEGSSSFSVYEPKIIRDQINCLCKLFPELVFINKKFVDKKLPQDAEGWFVVPRWRSIASTYDKAIEKVFDLMRTMQNRRLNIVYAGQMESQYLKPRQGHVKASKVLEKNQNGDFLFIPAQFGVKPISYPSEDELMNLNVNEFGLGIFEVSIMILTHPERFLHEDNLPVWCIGDEYSKLGNGEFLLTPFFRFKHKQLEINMWTMDDIYQAPFSEVGIATGFIV